MEKEVKDLLEMADEELAEMESRCTRLENELAMARARIAELEAQGEESRTVTTVAEAVERARADHGDVLIFGPDIEDGLENLTARAGPPNKVLDYLDHLAELGRLRREGPLGTSAQQWLREKGVDVSGESKNTRMARKSKVARTFQTPDGPQVFNAHLKPSDGTHINRCVRIYFAWDAERECYVIGNITRHL